jgi:hypothetical protein
MSSSESDKLRTDSKEDDLRVMQMITKTQNNLVIVAYFMQHILTRMNQGLSYFLVWLG